MFETRSVGAVRTAVMLGVFLLISNTPARAASPTNIGSCTTITTPGDYVLTKNLTSIGNCLILTVSNVAIDLHKHKITGSGSGAGITDNGNNIAYIIVANGKITNFAVGIDLSTDSDQTSDLILNVNASRNKGDGIHIRGRDNNLLNVTASSNQGNGVELGDCCDSLLKVTTNGNGGNGVSFSSEDYLLNVTSNSNSGDGVLGRSDSFVVNSVTDKNGGNGVELKDDDDLVLSSVANGNQGDGILQTGEDSQATNTKAGKNHAAGIDFQSEFGLATSVTTNKNGGDGVLLPCPGDAVRVSAKGNATNLDELSMDMCTNVRNSAP